jgi:GNAT superfamily N-acetyltransferase
MARLLGVLGYAIDPAALTVRWMRFTAAGEAALVAVASGLVTAAKGASAPSDSAPLLGLATLHVTPVLHRAGSVGRVTSLVVDPAARGHGVGRMLMRAAEEWAVGRGCVLMEVTSNRRRTDAHAFYERLGYAATSFRFGKELAPSAAVAAPGAEDVSAE